MLLVWRAFKAVADVFCATALWAEKEAIVVLDGRCQQVYRPKGDADILRRAGKQRLLQSRGWLDV